MYKRQARKLELDALLVQSPDLYAEYKSRFNKDFSYMELQNVLMHMGTLYKGGNRDRLPVYDRMTVSTSRNAGVLTLLNQCVDMAQGVDMTRDQVKALGFLWDSQWSRYSYKPGAYDLNNNGAKAVKRLVNNLGDETVAVIAEMLFHCGRRIAVLQGAGALGKTSITCLLYTSPSPRD